VNSSLFTTHCPLFIRMKSRQHKTEELSKIKDGFKKSKITVFTSFSGLQGKGLNVEEIKELRGNLRKTDSEFFVSKKTLINKVSNELGVDALNFDGSLGLVFGYGDEAAVAKEAYNFSKKHEALKILGALFGTKLLDGAMVIELAKLPSREMMLARLVGMIGYPLSGFVRVLEGNIRNLLLILSNIKK